MKRSVSKRGKTLLGTLGLALLLLSGGLRVPVAHADTAPSNFNLQVTPSPLVDTIKPGVKTTEPLKIHNGSTGTEELKISPRSFTYDSKTGKVNLEDTTPPAVASWVSFSAPKFTVQPGQWFTEQITFDVPKDAGFSYSFALVIERQSNPAPANGTRAINGSLAIFTLINIDRPGAKSSLAVVSFTSTKHLYEYLPATFNVRFQNTGNTIVQPYGNIFVQRTATSRKPLASLPVNSTKGYILPNTERTVTAQWNDGFATYQPVTQPDGSLKQQLKLDWSNLSHFRIGRYSANLVAVYSDGQHDVPIASVITFWVIPWRAILLLLVVIVLLWLFARWRGKRRTEKAVKRALAAQAAATKIASQKTAVEKKDSQS